MRVKPPVGQMQCPECGTPVDVIESLRFNEAETAVVVRSEPCGHEWEYRTS